MAGVDALNAAPARAVPIARDSDTIIIPGGYARTAERSMAWVRLWNRCRIGDAPEKQHRAALSVSQGGKERTIDHHLRHLRLYPRTGHDDLDSGCRRRLGALLIDAQKGRVRHVIDREARTAGEPRQVRTLLVAKLAVELAKSPPPGLPRTFQRVPLLLL